MDNLIIILLIALVIGNIAIFIVQLKNKPKEDNNNVEEKLKENLNSLKSSFSESFSSMSKEVAKDMNETLTRVD